MASDYSNIFQNYMVWKKLVCKVGQGGCLDRIRRGEGGIEGPTVAVAGSGAPPLDLGVRRVARSGGFHHFHWRCLGRGVFLLVQQNNNNTLHTNLSCKVLEDSTNNTYNMIVLQNTTKGMYVENVPRKN